jgi:hypothetical protein
MDIAPPPRPAETAYADPSRERAARFLMMLEELAEIGTDLARMMRQQAKAAQWLGTEAAVMFERVDRAVRRTIALAIRLDADWRMSAEEHAAEQACRAALLERARQRQDQVRRAVEDAIESHAHPSDAGNRVADLRERLADPDRDDELRNQPISVIVAAICKDLGITHDLGELADAEVGNESAPRDFTPCDLVETEGRAPGPRVPRPPRPAPPPPRPLPGGRDPP